MHMRPKTNGREIETLIKKAEMLNRRAEELMLTFIHVNKAMNKTIEDYKKHLIITEG